MIFSVYAIKNQAINEFLYIGCTRNYTLRTYQHLKLDTHLKEHIINIGRANIEIIKIADFTNRQDAFQYEDYLIKKHNTLSKWNKQKSGLRTYDRTEYSRKWRLNKAKQLQMMND